MNDECKKVMNKHPSHLWVDFFEIFNENSRKLRVKFFKNQLVQFMWARFRSEYRSQILDCLEKVYDYEASIERQNEFFASIINLEKETDFLIMPR